MTVAALAAAVLTGVAVLAVGDHRQVARSRLHQLPAPGGSREPRGDLGTVGTGNGLAGGAGTGASAGVVRAGAVSLSKAGSSIAGSASGRSAIARSAIARLAIAWVGVLALPIAAQGLGWGPVLAGLAPLLFLLTRRGRLARSAARRNRLEIASALPRFADLVAACLEAGAAPVDALDVVRRHIHGPLGDRLAPVVGALMSGVDPLTAYGDHGREDPGRALVVALTRAMDSGAPLADTVAAVADDQRRRRRWTAEAAARRAGVHAIGPLVVCFLPAFVLLGVVPVVLGMAAEVLGDLS